MINPAGDPSCRFLCRFGIAVAVCALAWPILAPSAPHPRTAPDSLARELLVTPDAGVMAFTKAVPVGAVIDAELSDMIEESQEETFDGSSCLAFLPSLIPDGPPLALIGPHSSSASRRLTLQLRC